MKLPIFRDLQKSPFFVSHTMAVTCKGLSLELFSDFSIYGIFFLEAGNLQCVMKCLGLPTAFVVIILKYASNVSYLGSTIITWSSQHDGKNSANKEGTVYFPVTVPIVMKQCKAAVLTIVLPTEQVPLSLSR